ncbi:DNA polymerase family B-domain-containing protein, partial [Baffinella frigidus]
DIYKYIKDNKKIDGYKLNDVAKIILNDTKDDLTPKELFEKYEGNASDRAIIAKYCIQDCILINRIFDKEKVYKNNSAISNVCKVTFVYIIERGQGVKSLALVAGQCMKENYLLPDIETTNDDNSKYEGAIVLEPKTGIYTKSPVVVFDFASLYPSSIIEKNLSPDTYIYEKTDEIMNNDNIEIQDINLSSTDANQIGSFVKYKNGKMGIVPKILKMLLDERNNAKKLKANSNNETEQNIYDALQNAYKLTANSLYG